MAREGPSALTREEGLRVEDKRVRVPVPHLAVDDAIVRNDAKATALGSAC